jgi:hypothetical protein
MHASPEPTRPARAVPFAVNRLWQQLAMRADSVAALEDPRNRTASTAFASGVARPVQPTAPVTGARAPTLFRQPSAANVPQPTTREILAAIEKPFSVKAALSITEEALDRASAWASGTYPGNREIIVRSLNMGTADAMRHAYWSASLTVALGEKNARHWTTAHEEPTKKLETGEELMLSEMDHFNNEVGFQMGLGTAQRLEGAGQDVGRQLDPATQEDLWEQVSLAQLRGDLKAVKVVPDGSKALTTSDDPIAF